MVFVYNVIYKVFAQLLHDNPLCISEFIFEIRIFYLESHIEKSYVTTSSVVTSTNEREIEFCAIPLPIETCTVLFAIVLIDTNSKKNVDAISVYVPYIQDSSIKTRRQRIKALILHNQRDREMNIRSKIS